MSTQHTTINPAVEFQSLPLEYIISSPLVAAVNAQKLAADSIKSFISGMCDKDGKPISVNFNINYNEGDVSKNASITAPLLSMVPVPHLHIDSLTTHFTYEIKQTATESQRDSFGAQTTIGSGAMINPWANISLQGSVTRSSSSDTTTGRSGTLEITMHASEAQIPEGLAKILTMLTNSIKIENKPDTQSGQ